jgi:hypothetical protein
MKPCGDTISSLLLNLDAPAHKRTSTLHYHQPPVRRSKALRFQTKPLRSVLRRVEEVGSRACECARSRGFLDHILIRAVWKENEALAATAPARRAAQQDIRLRVRHSTVRNQLAESQNSTWERFPWTSCSTQCRRYAPSPHGQSSPFCLQADVRRSR